MPKPLSQLIPDLENDYGEPSPSRVQLPRPLGAAVQLHVGNAGHGGADLDHPVRYKPDSGLVAAFRTALLLRRPLLLTGEPGTGKTQAANYLSWKLGYGTKALRFDAKSTSYATDLFYRFNTIGRFHAAQSGGSTNNVNYLHYNALGEAILRARNALDVIPETSPALMVNDILPKDFHHDGNPVQSVVLIDEIDKAPRDFPNDLLAEIENMRFRIQELDNIEVQAPTDFKPVTIITSNSEKNLPAAFLRRCVYYHIPKPDRAVFADIVKARLGWDPTTKLASDALDFLIYTRDKVRELQKKPATAELLDWLLILEAHGARPDQRFRDIQDTVAETLGALIKEGESDPKKILTAWPGLK